MMIYHIQDATPLITAMYCNYNSVEFIQLFMNRGTDMTQTDVRIISKLLLQHSHVDS